MRSFRSRRAERHAAAVLERLAEIGMEIAEALAAQVTKTPTADLAAAYAKVAQAVRRTLALEAHLEKELTARKEKPLRPAPVETA